MDGLSRSEVEALSAALLERGWDSARLAEAAGLHRETMRMLLEGRLRPTLDIRRRLAEALGVDPRGIE